MKPALTLTIITSLLYVHAMDNIPTDQGTQDILDRCFLDIHNPDHVWTDRQLRRCIRAAAERNEPAVLTKLLKKPLGSVQDPDQVMEVIKIVPNLVVACSSDDRVSVLQILLSKFPLSKETFRSAIVRAAAGGHRRAVGLLLTHSKGLIDEDIRTEAVRMALSTRNDDIAQHLQVFDIPPPAPIKIEEEEDDGPLIAADEFDGTDNIIEPLIPATEFDGADNLYESSEEPLIPADEFDPTDNIVESTKPPVFPTRYEDVVDVYADYLIHPEHRMPFENYEYLKPSAPPMDDPQEIYYVKPSDNPFYQSDFPFKDSAPPLEERYKSDLMAQVMNPHDEDIADWLMIENED